MLDSDTRSVGEIMTKEVIAVGANAMLDEAYRLMAGHGFRHAPVVTDDHEILGVVSDRDLLRTCVDDPTMAISGADRSALLSNHPVREAMSSDPETLDREASLSEACEMLLENKFDCLPVVEGRRLCGIITTADVLQEMIRRENSI